LTVREAPLILMVLSDHFTKSLYCCEQSLTPHHNPFFLLLMLGSFMLYGMKFHFLIKC